MMNAEELGSVFWGELGLSTVGEWKALVQREA
jgi:hypothetical protein